MMMTERPCARSRLCRPRRRRSSWRLVLLLSCLVVGWWVPATCASNIFDDTNHTLNPTHDSTLPLHQDRYTEWGILETLSSLARDEDWPLQTFAQLVQMVFPTNHTTSTATRSLLDVLVRPEDSKTSRGLNLVVPSITTQWTLFVPTNDAIPEYLAEPLLRHDELLLSNNNSNHHHYNNSLWFHHAREFVLANLLQGAFRYDDLVALSSINDDPSNGFALTMLLQGVTRHVRSTATGFDELDLLLDDNGRIWDSEISTRDGIVHVVDGAPPSDQLSYNVTLWDMMILDQPQPPTATTQALASSYMQPLLPTTNRTLEEELQTLSPMTVFLPSENDNVSDLEQWPEPVQNYIFFGLVFFEDLEPGKVLISLNDRQWRVEDTYNNHNNNNTVTLVRLDDSSQQLSLVLDHKAPQLARNGILYRVQEHLFLSNTSTRPMDNYTDQDASFWYASFLLRYDQPTSSNNHLRNHTTTSVVNLMTWPDRSALLLAWMDIVANVTTTTSAEGGVISQGAELYRVQTVSCPSDDSRNTGPQQHHNCVQAMGRYKIILGTHLELLDQYQEAMEEHGQLSQALKRIYPEAPFVVLSATPMIPPSTPASCQVCPFAGGTFSNFNKTVPISVVDIYDTNHTADPTTVSTIAKNDTTTMVKRWTCGDLDQALLSEQTTTPGGNCGSTYNHALPPHVGEWLDYYQLELSSYCECPNTTAPQLCESFCPPGWRIPQDKMDDSSVVNDTLGIMTCRDISNMFPHINERGVCNTLQKHALACCTEPIQGGPATPDSSSQSYTSPPFEILPPTPPPIPNDATNITIFTSFVIANQKGFTALFLSQGPDRDGLEKAFANFVQTIISADGQTNGDMRRLRRQASRQLQEDAVLAATNAELYRMEDRECPPLVDLKPPPATSNTTTTAPPQLSIRCQSVYARYSLWVVPSVPEEFVFRKYMQYTQSAIVQGLLQESLELVDPWSSLTIQGRSDSLFPTVVDEAQVDTTEPQLLANNPFVVAAMVIVLALLVVAMAYVVWRIGARPVEDKDPWDKYHGSGKTHEDKRDLLTKLFPSHDLSAMDFDRLEPLEHFQGREHELLSFMEQMEDAHGVKLLGTKTTTSMASADEDSDGGSQAVDYRGQLNERSARPFVECYGSASDDSGMDDVSWIEEPQASETCTSWDNDEKDSDYATERWQEDSDNDSREFVPEDDRQHTAHDSPW